MTILFTLAFIPLAFAIVKQNSASIVQCFFDANAPGLAGFGGSLVLTVDSNSKLNVNGKVLQNAKMNWQAMQTHAIHVHEFGDISNACANVGAHYDKEMSNPHGDISADHSNPATAKRHVGDWGNQKTDANGNLIVAIVDDYAQLADMVGRSIVVTKSSDDGVTQPDGNSGVLVACCFIDDGATPAFKATPAATTVWTGAATTAVACVPTFDAYGNPITTCPPVTTTAAYVCPPTSYGLPGQACPYYMGTYNYNRYCYCPWGYGYLCCYTGDGARSVLAVLAVGAALVALLV